MTLEVAIEKLTEAVDALTAAVLGAEAPPAPSEEPAEPPPPKTKAKAKGKAKKAPKKVSEPPPELDEEQEEEEEGEEVTQAMLREALGDVGMGNKREEAIAILADVGAKNLSTIDESDYAEVYEKLRALLDEDD